MKISYYKNKKQNFIKIKFLENRVQIIFVVIINNKIMI